VLIKDNHVTAAGSIGRAVAAARRAAPHVARVEVEAGSLVQVRAGLRAGADVILLDNLSPARVAEAVRLIAGRALVEVSGGITLANIRDYALPGVDVISVGALTHSAPAADLSLEVIGK
jgi:nicotinate-nucleotide pyrophosphorylase (carboxylating)